MEHVAHRLEVVGVVKQAQTGQALPEHDPQREDVGAGIDALTAHLLGGQIGELALDQAADRR